MISQFTSRVLCLGRHQLVSNRTSVASALANRTRFNLFEQTRFAGHAKWQNIASTKGKNDLAKCKMVSRYVQLVRKAIVSNGYQGDPKLNGKLQDVLSEASKMNVPKATLERAIARAVNVKILSVNLEIQGPGGVAVIARCETDNVNNLRRDVKKTIKKFDANLMQDDTLINMFQSRGYIRAAAKTKDNRDIDQDYAEEAAIMANAEEVNLEVYEDASDKDMARVWVFNTDALRLNACKGELEKCGLHILSHELDLVPYRTIDFGKATFDKIDEMTKLLTEMEQIVDVFHNAKSPSSGNES